MTYIAFFIWMGGVVDQADEKQPLWKRIAWPILLGAKLRNWAFK